MITKNKWLDILILVIIVIVGINLLQFTFGILTFLIKLAIPFIVIYGLWKLFTNSSNNSRPY